MEEGNQEIASDMIYGAEEIGRFLGLPKRRVYHVVNMGHLPVFRLGSGICARKSTLIKWIRQQEEYEGNPSQDGHSY